MKVLEVVHGFPPTAEGGAEIYAQAHSRALRGFGDEVLVFTREQDANRAEYDVRYDERDGLRIVSVNNTFRRTRTFEETYRHEAVGAIASRVIDDFRPDVAHIHHLTCLSTTIVRSLAERRIPCFLTLHDYWLMCHRGQLLDLDNRVCDGPEPAGCHNCLGPAGGAGRVSFLGATTIRAFERRLPAVQARHLRRAAERLAAVASSPEAADNRARHRLEHMRAVCAEATHLFAPSRYMCDRFVRFGVPRERITVAGYGFDHSPFRGITRRSSDRLRLGFLGSLMVSKAPHVLLEAVSRLPQGTVSVDLYGAYLAYHGDDSYRDRLEPLLNREGVRAHGRIAHESVAQALSSIDVLVVPSIWPENSPLVIQEAFLAGVPVVASRIGGIPEAVDDGRNGLLFRAGDSEDLARVLTRLIRESGLLDTLRSGISAVRTIEEDVRFVRHLYQAHLSAGAVERTSSSRLAAIVLNHCTPDDTLLAIKSLLASRRPIDDLILVNNDSVDLGRDTFQLMCPRVTCLHTGRNIGFSGGMNTGVREALARGADRVLLVNSDVVVPPDCVERLERCLDGTAHTGIAGPVLLSRSEPDRLESRGMSYAPISGRMRHRGADAAAGQVGEASAVDGVTGCLMLVKREVFEAIGLLDEDYFFSFEDLDFCLRARRAGFSTVVAATATAYHEGARSIGAASPRRLYFAARNHLLMAERIGPSTSNALSFARACSIVALNLAHAVRSDGASLPARMGAVLRGTRDYFARRVGTEG